MYGPCPKGHWTANLQPRDFGPLGAGNWYVVTRAFDDFDKVRHPVGEAWCFLGSNFLPYDDGLSLFVSLDGEQEWHIRMCWRPEDQGPIINALEDHVRLAPD